MESPPYTMEFQNDTLRRVTWRLIPCMMLLYFIAFLDRANVGYAEGTLFLKALPVPIPLTG